jgi:chaperonin GroEL (HSP60 family)
MPLKRVATDSETDQRLTALISNAAAVRAITETVEGTLGPKGLDCMLVDRDGTVLVTNDGVTILKLMAINHPVAQMVISAALQQEAQVGDGTTTTTVLVGALIAEGVNQVGKGVPVIKVIAGIKAGIAAALERLQQIAVPVVDLDSPILERIALIAGRGHQDLADLVVGAAQMVGATLLKESGFKLADQIIAREGVTSHLICGTVINREPLSKGMPQRLTEVKLLILDDALEPEKVETDALRSNAGYEQLRRNQSELLANLGKLVELGVKAIFTDRGISGAAEDLLTDAGIIAVGGVARSEWQRLAQLSGARPVKRGALAKPPAELTGILGEVAAVTVDGRQQQLWILGKAGRNFVTMVVGAATGGVAEERERIAKDAAAAVQAAWCGGVVPGGGSVELSLSRYLRDRRCDGMLSYGYHCVAEALKRPMAQICCNAGFNPLEKLEGVLSRQETEDCLGIGVNCETGAIEDLAAAGIWDPYIVKHLALKSAGEVCEAILRVRTIIKMRETAAVLS